MSLLSQDMPFAENPLDLVEEMVSANDWAHDRSSDLELMAEISGHWCDYHLCAVWQPEVSAMYLSCQLDGKVPPLRRGPVYELLALANERMWLGHFELAVEEGMVLFRHTVPLRGTRGVSVEQLEDLVDTAILECDRFYPALQLVVWGDRPVAEAIEAAMMDTVGEA